MHFGFISIIIPFILYYFINDKPKAPLPHPYSTKLSFGIYYGVHIYFILLPNISIMYSLSYLGISMGDFNFRFRSRKGHDLHRY
jgi:hypothetical protein